MVTANSIGTTTFTTPSDVEIVATRTFDAPRRLVWEAFTNPEHVPNWLLGPEGRTMPVCELDLRPGGARHTGMAQPSGRDRKSTRLNSSHSQISYAVLRLNEDIAGE